MSVHDASAEASRQQHKAYAHRLWQYKQAETVAVMLHVGRRLGLFQQLMHSGPTTAAELALKTGLHERWLLEWLRLQAAAKVLEFTAPDRFELPEAGIGLLADDTNTAYMLDNFEGGTANDAIEGLLESFKTWVRPTNPQAPRVPAEAKHGTGAQQNPRCCRI